MTGEAQEPSPGSPTPAYGTAFLAASGVWLIYLLTLAPTAAFWDASEYITTAHILGIPHPPGNPLFVVLGRIWSVLLAPTGLPVAVRINLFAATTSAVAAFFHCLVAHRLLSAGREDGWYLRLGAAVSVLLGGTAFTVWNQSNVNEKVYTLSMAILAAVLWLGFRWRDTRYASRSPRLLLAATYLMALGVTNHLMSLLALPALLALVLAGLRGSRLPMDFWLRGAALMVLGLSFNAFLPTRSSQMPVINEGQPSCDSRLEAAVAVATLGATGCPALAAVLTREQYGKPPLTQRQASFRHQLLNWYQYFDWQWGRGLDPSPLPGGGRTPLTLTFLLLGMVGLAGVLARDRGAFLALAALVTTLTVGLTFYLNFRQGYSLALDLPDPSLREVRERDYFFMAGFQLWGVLAGMGLTFLGLRAIRRTRRWWVGLCCLAPAFLPLALNLGWAHRGGDHAAREWAYNLLQSVAPYGILLTNGDNDTFPLWYLQEVEGLRQDVTVVVVQYLYTEWYPEQLRYLTEPQRQRPFDSRQGTGVHPTPQDPPSRSVFLSPPEEVAELRGGQAGESFRVPVGGVALTFPEGAELNRAELLTLLLLSENWGERPFYFAATTGMASALGLDGWTIREGLAHRFLLEPPGEVSGAVRTSPGLGGEWVDLNRSLTLAQEVFGYRGLRDRALWPDRATANIPWHLYLLHLQLADATLAAGRGEDLARALQAEADAFLRLARGGERGTWEPGGSSR